MVSARSKLLALSVYKDDSERDDSGSSNGVGQNSRRRGPADKSSFDIRSNGRGSDHSANGQSRQKSFFGQQQ